MPRQPRIDSLNFLHHVTVRGIERGEIFYDDEVRGSFVARLRMLLLETNDKPWGHSILVDLSPHYRKPSTMPRTAIPGKARERS